MKPRTPGVGSDGEERLSDFAQLVATAISNAEAHADLTTSRARIERDLHDGAQQRLVALALRVRSLQASLPCDDELASQIADIGDGLAAANEELRQISHGIHPAVLPAAAYAKHRPPCAGALLCVNVKRRLPESVEVAAYYVVAEALTSAAKHACASLVTVTVDADDERVRLSVADDGVGRANPDAGSGLIGLKDRVEALGGHLDIISRQRQGTKLAAEIPRAAV